MQIVDQLINATLLQQLQADAVNPLWRQDVAGLWRHACRSVVEIQTMVLAGHRSSASCAALLAHTFGQLVGLRLIATDNSAAPLPCPAGGEQPDLLTCTDALLVHTALNEPDTALTCVLQLGTQLLGSARELVRWHAGLVALEQLKRRLAAFGQPYSEHWGARTDIEHLQDLLRCRPELAGLAELVEALHDRYSRANRPRLGIDPCELAAVLDVLQGSPLKAAAQAMRKSRPGTLKTVWRVCRQLSPQATRAAGKSLAALRLQAPAFLAASQQTERAL